MPFPSRCFGIVVALLIFTIFFAYCLTTWNGNAAKKIPNKDMNSFVELGNVTKINAFVNVMNDGTDVKKRLPKAIIIGSNKSGTRALLVILKMHPDINACSDEVHFFNREENYMRGLEWYRARMPESTADKLTIEKSPGYFITRNVPERVYSMSKDIKLLVIVRDPTIRAISEYTQLAVKANSSLPKFEVESSLSKTQLLRSNWLRRFLNLRPMITEKNFYFNKTKGFPCFIGKIGLHGKKKNGCLKGTKGRKHIAVEDDIVALLQDYYRPFNQALYKLVGRDFHWA
ncbi:hypothetical protein OS493_026448 [Desmophyllum pertusum]|uniref:Sulfotransferase domain-containing protein n=1 Tax=Desmophyllum pertusum TaxID=174260 RepID=A0A9W9YXN9_9CNID|nr:hypothetical protein OS493_026448 [Desmophyllum pertusum]